MIVYEKRKKQKPKKLTVAQQALADEWVRIVESHKKPLVKGAIANGVKIAKPAEAKIPVLLAIEPAPPKMKDLPIPLNPKSVGTKPITDELIEAKRNLAGRVGVSYNKGGIQYLTDDELKEQQSGSHRRR